MKPPDEGCSKEVSVTRRSQLTGVEGPNCQKHVSVMDYVFTTSLLAN